MQNNSKKTSKISVCSLLGGGEWETECCRSVWETEWDEEVEMQARARASVCVGARPCTCACVCVWVSQWVRWRHWTPLTLVSFTWSRLTIVFLLRLFRKTFFVTLRSKTIRSRRKWSACWEEKLAVSRLSKVCFLKPLLFFSFRRCEFGIKNKNVLTSIEASSASDWAGFESWPLVARNHGQRRRRLDRNV